MSRVPPAPPCGITKVFSHVDQIYSVLADIGPHGGPFALGETIVKNLRGSTSDIVPQ